MLLFTTSLPQLPVYNSVVVYELPGAQDLICKCYFKTAVAQARKTQYMISHNHELISLSTYDSDGSAYRTPDGPAYGTP